MAVYKFVMGKLVRDKVVSDILADNVPVTYHTMDDTSYRTALKEKLIEEIEELRTAQSREEQTMEFADVLETIMAYAKNCNITMDEIEAARQSKAAKKGAFDEKLFVEHVELDETHSWFEYFNTQPDKYRKVGNN